MWIGVVLNVLVCVYPGEVIINGPNGAVNIILQEEEQGMANQGQITINAIVTSINVRLKMLGELQREQALTPHDCMRLIEEIQFLLKLLPMHFYFPLDPSLFDDILEQSACPMSTADFSILTKDLDEEPFSMNKLKILKVAVLSNFFLVEQVETLLECFAFEDDRVEAVRILYPQILDDENAYRLFNKFMFSNSKEELTKILQ
jgi:hypothetical protein